MDHDEETHPYRSLDPFDPSISHQIHNRRRTTINSVEDIAKRLNPSRRVSKNRRDGDEGSLDGKMWTRPLERRKSQTGATSTPAPGRPLRETDIDHRGAHNDPPTNVTRSRGRVHHSFDDSSYFSSFDKADSGVSGCFDSLRSPRIKEGTSEDGPNPEEKIALRDKVFIFLTEIVPHQIYLHCLLRLPYFYFSRVEQIFENANLTLRQLLDMALQVSAQGSGGDENDDRVAMELPKAYWRLKKAWERFIDNLLREWKTLNIISGLLLSGILTIFQIDGTQRDPVTRYMAFWSLISALLSLLYGCIFIIRFSGMRKVYQATEWAIQAQKRGAWPWNVWVMLSMPAVWLVWSILAYITCIMAFMWRVNPDDPKPTLGPHAERRFKAFICCVLGVGVLYAILIVNTLRKYGSKMDKSWRDRIAKFRSEHLKNAPRTPALSPLLGLSGIEPTPPQKQPSLRPRHLRQTSPPPTPTTNRSSFAGKKTNQSEPFIPRRPSPATPTSNLPRSSDLPSPSSSVGHYLPLDAPRTRSASPTPMTPEESISEASTSTQSPLNRHSDKVPGVPGTGNVGLGLFFPADGAVSSSGSNVGPGSNMG